MGKSLVSCFFWLTVHGICKIRRAQFTMSTQRRRKAELSHWSSVHRNTGHTKCTFRSRSQQTRYTQKQHKVHVISPTSLQHNTSYTMFDWTFLEVYLNGHLMFEQFITQTTDKLFVFWMYWMMKSQFICCTETLWTSTANIRLHSFISTNVYFENLFAAEFLVTNVTREPSAFIVWFQQMCL